MCTLLVLVRCACEKQLLSTTYAHTHTPRHTCDYYQIYVTHYAHNTLRTYFIVNKCTIPVPACRLVDRTFARILHLPIQLLYSAHMSRTLDDDDDCDGLGAKHRGATCQALATVLQSIRMWAAFFCLCVCCVALRMRGVDLMRVAHAHALRN